MAAFAQLMMVGRIMIPSRMDAVRIDLPLPPNGRVSMAMIGTITTRPKKP